MKYLVLLAIAIVATAQVTIVVDPTVSALDAVPNIASVGEISPASTSSRIVVNVDGDCTTAEQELKGIGYGTAQ
ncbi:hypothetical protein BGZ82_011601, partial [Podila clonocystis]